MKIYKVDNNYETLCILDLDKMEVKFIDGSFLEEIENLMIPSFMR